MKKTRTVTILIALVIISCLVIPFMPMAAENSILEGSWIVGDTDGDSKVTILDATHIQRFLAAIIQDSDGRITKCGDVDNDGLSIIDATNIQRYLASLPYDGSIGQIIENPTEPFTDASTENPTSIPTETHTEKPTDVPTSVPSDKPTEAPTSLPTEKPTEAPTSIPTEKPTEKPTEPTTEKPTEPPTSPSTEMPTGNDDSEYTVRFVDYDGSTLIKSQVVQSGKDALPPSNPSKPNTTFLGWSGNYYNVSQNEIVKAIYSDEKNVFIAKSAEGSVGSTVKVLLSIDGSVKTCAFDLTVMYDPSLELISYDDDLDLDVLVNTGRYENGLKMNFSSASDNKTRQRDIIELTFRIKNTTKKHLPIIITVNSMKELSDMIYVNAPYTVIDGCVTVK